MRRPERGFALIGTGTVLILSALLLFLLNLREDRQAGQGAGEQLAALQQTIRERSPAERAAASGEPGSPGGPGAETPERTGPEAEPSPLLIDGYAYLGYLSLPALELELPVLADWNYDWLQLAPCRQFGTAPGDDLVIAAHNYESHFGRLRELSPGDPLSFTAADGSLYSYAVNRIAILEPGRVEEVQNSGHALVLYTCTVGGQARVIAFCDRVSGGRDTSGTA